MTRHIRTDRSPRGTVIALALPVSLALLLSGCAGGTSGLDWNGANGFLDTPRQGYTLTETVPPATALAVLGPEAGPVLEVVRSDEGDTVRQRVVLGGDAATVGENALDIRLSRETPAPVTSATISAEMRAALPHRTLAMADALAQNRYGPFGWAVTTRGTPSCAYAWQRVTGRAGGLPGLGRRRTLDLRLRLCGANATEATIRAAMGALRLTDDPERTLRAGAVAWAAPRGPQVTAPVSARVPAVAPKTPPRQTEALPAARPTAPRTPPVQRKAGPASGAFPMPPA